MRLCLFDCVFSMYMCFRNETALVQLIANLIANSNNKVRPGVNGEPYQAWLNTTIITIVFHFSLVPGAIIMRSINIEHNFSLEMCVLIS